MTNRITQPIKVAFKSYMSGDVSLVDVKLISDDACSMVGPTNSYDWNDKQILVDDDCNNILIKKLNTLHSLLRENSFQALELNKALDDGVLKIAVDLTDPGKGLVINYDPIERSTPEADVKTSEQGNVDVSTKDPKLEGNVSKFILLSKLNKMVVDSGVDTRTLAGKINITERRLREVLDGENRALNIPVLLKICDALGYTLDFVK